LRLQAEISEKGRTSAVCAEFETGAELTHVPDERILAIYRALRPHRSSKQELLDIATELEDKYNAKG